MGNQCFKPGWNQAQQPGGVSQTEQADPGFSAEQMEREGWVSGKIQILEKIRP